MRLAARNMRALDVTVTTQLPGDALVNGQDAGPGVVIAGDTPPKGLPSWWWLVALGALVVGWYMVKDDTEEEGRHVPRPFVG